MAAARGLQGRAPDAIIPGRHGGRFAGLRSSPAHPVKQPAKVSLAGAVLAVLAAIFYPKLTQESDAATAPPPAVSQTEAGGDASQRPAAPAKAARQVEQPAVEPPSGTAAAPSKPGAATADAVKSPSTTSGGARAPPRGEPAPAAKPPAAKPPAAKPPAAKAPAAKTAPTSKVGFTSRQSWLDHFEKHGAEFGKITADEYLARAQALRDAPLVPTVLEGVRSSDGVITRFDKKTGAFIAYHKDKSIRTFFRPNDGVAYFKRQLER